MGSVAQLEDFKLPPGLEIDAQWELKNVVYTVWDIQKQFVHLKDPSGQVTAFKLERAVEGRAYPQII